eukprot:5385771-Pyramimonas_sp.AAC.1
MCIRDRRIEAPRGPVSLLEGEDLSSTRGSGHNERHCAGHRGPRLAPEEGAAIPTKNPQSTSWKKKLCNAHGPHRKRTRRKRKKSWMPQQPPNVPYSTTKWKRRRRWTRKIFCFAKQRTIWGNPHAYPA